MITVYVFGNAPRPVWDVTRDLRVLWALEESGLPYRLHPLDFAKGDLARPAYLLGEEFSAPDILMTSVLRLVQHTDLLRAAPHVAAYQERCEARPAWTKVVAEHHQRLAA